MENCEDLNVLKSIEIRGMWKKYNFIWKNLNPDVNVLIGINGSGKTTLFNVLDAVLCGDIKVIKHYGVEVDLTIGDKAIYCDVKTKPNDLKKQIHELCYQKVSTFDVPSKGKKGKVGRSDLYNELHEIVYQIGGDQPSFSDYRLKATNFPEQADHINKRIRLLFSTIDRLFKKTGKTISIDPYTNKIVFDDGGEIISLEKLSSGEKQIMLILFKVFLMDEQAAILLMDEPEISLHIEWQHILFEEIRKLNPRCQIITSTHSPSIFGDGWSDKLFFVEDLVEVL